MKQDATQALRQRLHSLTIGTMCSFRDILVTTDVTKLTKPDDILSALATARILVQQSAEALAQLMPALDAICKARRDAIDDAVGKIRRKTEQEVTLDRIGKAHFKEVSGYAKRCIDRLVEEAQGGQDEYDFEHGTTSTDEDE